MTVTPDLPSTLTYNCSFSVSGDMFPLVVEAIEVVAGSLYQCDITAAVTDLGSVKEGLLSCIVYLLFCSSSLIRSDGFQFCEC